MTEYDLALLRLAEEVRDLKRRLASIERWQIPAIVDGTFTPTWSGSGTPGTFTYTAQDGYYFTVFGLVYIQLRLNISAISVSPTGNARIAGLPFAAHSLTNGAAAVNFGFVSQINLSANCIQLTGTINPGSSLIELTEVFDNANGGVLPAAAINATAQVSLDGWYRRAT